MKNLLKNRKGFTLAEILLVVAIIVILSGATVIGVASWVNQSQTTAHAVESKSAAFEADAVDKVLKAKGNVGSDPHETETLNTGATQNQNNNTPDPNDDKPNQNNDDPKPGPGANDPKPGPGDDKPKDNPPALETEGTTAGETSAVQSQGGGTTDALNSPFSLTSGSKTITADPSKKLKQVIIEWENNNKESWGMAYSQFVVTYNNSKGGNYDNKNDTIGGQSNSDTVTINVGVEGCSGINIKHGSGKLTIKSIKYVYED